MKTPPLRASLLLMAGLGILCTLGVWQLQRLEWKRDILAMVEQQAALDPAQHPLGIEDFREGRLYHRGIIRGAFDYRYEIALGPRTQDQEVGYHLYTPFRMEGGGLVMVNRGWVSSALKQAEARPETIIPGPLALEGMIVPMPRANAFTPENNPDAGEWYVPDPVWLEKVSGTAPAPVSFQVERSPYEGTQIVRVSPYKDIPNDHMQYAMFWFAMAGALLAVFYFRFLR